nr:MAG TPA: hypothetical protein [Herelleviridae sp.]
MSYTKELLEDRGYDFDNMSMLDKMNVLLKLLEEPEVVEHFKKEYQDFSKERDTDGE